MIWEILNAAIVTVTDIAVIGFVLPWMLPDANDNAKCKLPVLQRLSIFPVSLLVCAVSFAVSLATGHHETDGNVFSQGICFGFGAVILLYVADMIYITPGVKLTVRIIAGGLLAVGGFGIHSMPWWTACLLAVVLVPAICYTLDFVNISVRLYHASLASILFCLGIILMYMDMYHYGLFAMAVAGGLVPLVVQERESRKNENAVNTRIHAIGAIIALLLLEVIWR